MERKELGTRLLALLHEHHMTQKELAEKVQITEASLSCYIRGTRVPRSSVLAKIAATLGTTSEYLLGGEDQTYVDEIGLARRLIARNVNQMSSEEKNDLLKILLMSEK